MDAIQQLMQRLKETAGDTHAQAALAAEFALTTRPAAERETLRAALDAAAVLRWFDAGLLAQVLDIPAADASRRFAMLKTLPFVESYPGAGLDRRNVHEATRLGWRKKLFAETPERFRALSLLASACFAEDVSAKSRIEWIYHLLCGDPERGATELEKLDREWGSQAYPEDRYALAAALRELEDTRLVAGRARAWALLVIAWVRYARGETAQLADIAQTALRLARENQDQRAEADAQCLRGDVSQAQGKLEAARAAYRENLVISRWLAESDPSNAGWQRELAVAHSRVGVVSQALGQLEGAQAAFAEDLAISRRLAEADPSNASWQRDLAVAHSRVGGVSRALGQWEAAQAAFAEDLAISCRLAEADPSNASWQRDLAVAHSKIGDVSQAQGQLEAARAAFGESLVISRRLAESDPSNADWQRELAVACWWIAWIQVQAGQWSAALPLYEEASRLFAALVKLAPEAAQWAKEREIVEAELAQCRSFV